MNSQQPAKPPEIRSGSASAATPPDSGTSAATDQQPISVPSVPSCSNLTPRQERLWTIRLRQVREGQRLKADGYTHRAAASEVGIGSTTLWRFETALRQNGPDALIPKPGRPPRPAIDPSIYSDDLVMAVQRLACIYGSAKAGGLAFAQSGQCPPALAEFITKRRTIPDELRRRVAFKRRRLSCRTAGTFVRIEGIPNQIAT